MIALNDIIKNKEIYEKRYALKGKKVDFDKIFCLADKMKELQLLTESLRANCNKLCGRVAVYRNENKDIKALINEIQRCDDTINGNNRKLFKINNKINKILNKLDNLPIHENLRNEVLQQSDKKFDKINVEKYISNLGDVKIIEGKMVNHLKSMQNMILDSPNQIFKCSDGFLFLASHKFYNDTLLSLTNYFRNNSSQIIRLGLENLSRQSSDSYIIKLNDMQKLKIDIVDEYLTREYKIKYHDSVTDMTKFVKQINLYFED